MFTVEQESKINDFAKFGVSREDAIKELGFGQEQAQEAEQVQVQAEQHFSALADDAYQLPKEIANKRAEHAERMAQMPVMEMSVIQPQVSNVVVEEPVAEPAQAQATGVISFMKQFFTKAPVTVPEPENSDSIVQNTTKSIQETLLNKLGRTRNLIDRAAFEKPEAADIANDSREAESLQQVLNLAAMARISSVDADTIKKINVLYGKYIIFSDRPGISALYDKLNQVKLGQKRFDANLDLVAANKSYGTRASTQKAAVEAVKMALINRVLELLPLYHIVNASLLTLTEQKVKGLAKEVIAKLNETEIHRVVVMKMGTEKVEIDSPIREREFMNS